MKPIVTCMVWLSVTCALHALPINQYVIPPMSTANSQRTSSSRIPSGVTHRHHHHHVTSTHDGTDGFDIQIDRFAQLVSTHWQFDHLESIISNTYKEIAAQMRQHIQIIVSSNPPVPHQSEQQQQQQQLVLTDSPMDGMMDLRLLKAQLLGAIQAHTEGNLPMAWDRLGDKLSRPALEVYFSHLVLSYCETTSNSPEDGVIPSQCLASNAEQITAQFDHYISTHLINVFDALLESVVPDLLQQTADNLKQVLDYFNQASLNKDHIALSLDVIPLQDRQEHVRARLVAVAHQSVNNDNHKDDLVSRYAVLAQI